MWRPTPPSSRASFCRRSGSVTTLPRSLVQKSPGQALKDLHTEQQIETAARGWNGVPPWVFYGLLPEAGLRKVRFHDLRHTFASLLLPQGESLVYVKEQMGHSSIQVTVDLYGHLTPGGE